MGTNELYIVDEVADRRPPMAGIPLSEERCNELARRYKAIGDPVRLRLLSLIASHLDGEVCVCELVGAFDLSQSTISHHLKILRDVGLVESERRASWVYYRISPAARESLGCLLEHPQAAEAQ
ncbi:ArsR/SmtB family transcription factor [Streptomyces sp. NPDC000941]